MKNKIVPIASVLVGLLAFMLTYQYLRGKEAEIQKLRQDIMKGARQIQVMSVIRDVPGGARLETEDLINIPMPETYVPEDVVKMEDAQLILNKKTKREIKAKKAIQWSNIEGGSPKAGGLAAMVEPGMRAVSLPIGGASAVGNMVQPGDRIDVLGTFALPSSKPGEVEVSTLTLLQDVTVLAVGQTMAKSLANLKKQGQTSYSTVTLMVTPREAEVLVFAQQMKGNLTLSLRNPTDSHYELKLPEINFTKVKDELEALNTIRQRDIRHKPVR